MGSTGSSGQEGEGSEGQQAGQEGNPNQSETEGTYSVNGSGNPDANSTAGVSQNAMEFLQGLGKGGSSAGEGNQGDSTEGDGPGGESPTPSEARSQAQVQAGEQDNSPVNNGIPGTAQEQNTQSTAGTSQNAMEFLKGTSDQSGSEGEQQASTDGNGQQDSPTEGQESSQANTQDSGQDSGQSETQGDQQADGQSEGETQDVQQTETEQESALPSPTTSDSTSPAAETKEESTAGAAQNALEYLTGESTQPSGDTGSEVDSDQQQGTLTIQDLLNAQGVDGAPAKPVDVDQTDETTPEKDSDG